jgi:hypothetical protein
MLDDDEDFYIEDPAPWREVLPLTLGAVVVWLLFLAVEAMA